MFPGEDAFIGDFGVMLDPPVGTDKNGEAHTWSRESWAKLFDAMRVNVEADRAERRAALEPGEKLSSDEQADEFIDDQYDDRITVVGWGPVDHVKMAKYGLIGAGEEGGSSVGAKPAGSIESGIVVVPESVADHDAAIGGGGDGTKGGAEDEGRPGSSLGGGDGGEAAAEEPGGDEAGAGEPVADAVGATAAPAAAPSTEVLSAESGPPGAGTSGEGAGDADVVPAPAQDVVQESEKEAESPEQDGTRNDGVLNEIDPALSPKVEEPPIAGGAEREQHASAAAQQVSSETTVDAAPAPDASEASGVGAGAASPSADAPATEAAPDPPGEVPAGEVEPPAEGEGPEAVPVVEGTHETAAPEPERRPTYSVGYARPNSADKKPKRTSTLGEMQRMQSLGEMKQIVFYKGVSSKAFESFLEGSINTIATQEGRLRSPPEQTKLESVEEKKPGSAATSDDPFPPAPTAEAPARSEDPRGTITERPDSAELRPASAEEHPSVSSTSFRGEGDPQEVSFEGEARVSGAWGGFGARPGRGGLADKDAQQRAKENHAKWRAKMEGLMSLSKIDTEYLYSWAPPEKYRITCVV